MKKLTMTFSFLVLFAANTFAQSGSDFSYPSLAGSPAQGSQVRFLNNLQNLSSVNQRIFIERVFNNPYLSDGDQYRVITNDGCVGSSPTTKSRCLSQGEENFIRNYMENGYEYINRVLRESGYDALWLVSRQTVGYLDAALKKSRPLQGVVFRGVNSSNFFQSLKVGDTYSDPAYLSTSVSANVAWTFANMDGKTNGTLMTLYSKTCVPIDFIRATPKGEKEVLCPRDTKFRIVYRETVNGRLYLFAEEI